MSKIAFMDETGIHDVPYYTIGALIIEEQELQDVNDKFNKWKTEKKIIGEVKWKDIDKNYSAINLGLGLLQRILEGKYIFHAMVVDKDRYRNWKKNRDEAFYQTVTILLKHIADRVVNDSIKVFLDQRSTKYPKHDEVTHIIANRMLSKDDIPNEIKSVIQVSSREYPGLQMVDLLIGAINTAHIKEKRPSQSITVGKEIFIERMSNMLGWPGLNFDTVPKIHFNIWHFPLESRGETREIDFNPYKPVTKEDIDSKRHERLA